MDINKKNNLRWHLPIVYSLIILAIILFSLPTFLSLSFCKPFIERRLSHIFHGDVHIANIHLSWFTPQYVERFEYASFDKSSSFHFKSLKVSATLFKYLITPYLSHLSDPAVTELISPVLTLNKPLLNSSPSKKATTPFLFFIQNLSIVDGTFLYHDQELAELDHLNIKLQLQHDKISHLSAKGSSLYGNTKGMFDIAISSTSNVIPYQLDIILEEFPLAGIDRLCNFKGLLQEAFGPALNAHITLHTPNDHSALVIEMDSTHLQASVNAQILEHSISLLKPASISVLFTPHTFELIKEIFVLNSSLSMTRNASLQLLIDDFELPYEGHYLHLNHLSYHAKLGTSPLAFRLSNTDQPISINALNLSSATKNSAESIDISLSSSFNYYLKNPSSINATLKLKEIFTNNFVHSISDLSLDVMKFPIILLDTALALDPTLVNLFGETANIQIAPTLLSAQKEYTARFVTPRMQIPEIQFLLDHKIQLQKPAAITYIPNHDWMTHNFDSAHLTLSKTGKLYGSLETCSFNLNESDLSKALEIQLDINSDDIALSSSMTTGVLTCKNAQISIKTHSLDHLDITSSTTLLYSDELSPEQDVLGGPTKLIISANVDLKNPTDILLPHLECSIVNAHTNISMRAALEEHFTHLRLLEPMSIAILPSSKTTTQWLGIYNPALTYVFTPIQITMALQPIYLNQPIFEQLSLNASINLPKLDLVDKVFLREFIYLNTQAQLILNVPHHTCEGSLQTTLKESPARSGSLSCSFSSNTYTSWDSLKQHFKLSTTCQGMPSSFLDTVCGYKNALHILIGETFEGSVELLKQKDLLHITAQGMGSQLALSGECDLSNAALTIKKSVECDLKAHPKLLSAIEQIFNSSIDSCALKDHAFVRFTAKNLYLPLDQLPYTVSTTPFSLKGFLTQLTSNLSQSYFHITARSDHIDIVSNKSQKTTSLQDTIFESIKTAPHTPLLLEFNSSITEEPNQKGHITSTTTLQAVKNSQGKPMLLSKINAEFKHFPTLLIDSFFEVFGFKSLPPSVLLGQEINASLNIDLENLSGHIDADINSSDAKGNLNAFLTDGILKLYKPIRASLNITPKFADFFLNKMNVGLTLAKNPLELFIADQGFYFPIEAFDITKMQIRKARASLGKILCDNRGNPMDISGFFHLQQDSRHQLSLWFAPMDFCISNGIIQIDRTEVLFNDAYQIAFWGKLDLAKNYVNMVLGLTEQSLRKALGIRGLPKSFVLQIPMTGPINNVRVNKEIATTRIAFLLAKASGLTDHSGLWGGIVNALGDFANDQTTVPPAKPPFPWKEALSKYEAEEQKRSTAHIIN